MNRYFNNYFVLIFLLFTFCHCEQWREVEVEIPFEGEKMVVYGTISNTGIARVEIWLTGDLNISQNISMVEGGTAEITNQDGQTFPLRFDENIGCVNIPISANNTYFLSATYQDLSVVSTEVVIPSTTSIMDYSIDFNGDSTELVIKTKFQDIEEDVNFYGYEIEKIENGVLIEKIPVDYNNLISDIDFNGIMDELLIQTKREVPIFDSDQQLIRLAYIDRLIVKLYSVSKDIDSFYTSIKNNNGEIGNQFSEQTPPVTNIINGYGYFGGIASDSIVIDL